MSEWDREKIEKDAVEAWTVGRRRSYAPARHRDSARRFSRRAVRGKQGGKIMRRFRFLLNAKVLLAVAIVLVGVAIYVASLPKSDAIIGPGVCVYYKDATFKKAVGARGTGCCGEPISWGVTSAYVKCERLYCTDVVCPNNS